MAIAGGSGILWIVHDVFRIRIRDDFFCPTRPVGAHAGEYLQQQPALRRWSARRHSCRESTLNMESRPVLHTERLTLRGYRESDIAELVPLIGTKEVAA